MNKKILCPICKKITDLTKANLYRPFCTKRCRLIDLGQWTEGAYVVPETNLDDVWKADEYGEIKH